MASLGSLSKSLLRNQNAILVLGFILGLAVGDSVPWAKEAVMPTLMVIMAAATLSVETKDLIDPRRLFRPALLAVLLNYGLLTGAILALGQVVALDQDLWAGVVILAVVPPAVAVIPYTDMVGGNTALAVIGTMGTYIVGLALAPLLAVALLGASVVSPWDILVVLAQLIVGPLVASRLLRLVGATRWLAPYKGDVVNWSYFVFFLCVVGLNRAVFLGEFNVLGLMVLLAIATMFVLGWVINLIAGGIQVSRTDRHALVFLATLKNTGMASAVAISLFNARAAVPAAVLTAMIVPYYIWVAYRARRATANVPLPRESSADEHCRWLRG